MSRSIVERIADAVLYEGYILYPYRPSVKNRQRWTFGGLYPEAYSVAQGGTEPSGNQTECLVRGDAATTLRATVRFLHLTHRLVGEFVPPLPEWGASPKPVFRPVETLRVGDGQFHTWQEAEERELDLGTVGLGELLDRPRRRTFTFPERRWLEPLPAPGGTVAGVLVREQQALTADVEATATQVAEGLYRLSLRVRNRTEVTGGALGDRDAALLGTLVSTHAILGVRQGEFVSLLEPPSEWREAAAACRNVGTWPVLVGDEGQRDTMLSSPIILYDYPQVAPESPGDFFDGTEIDEMLTLRILTLTDAEKQSMAAVDARARALLARTEGLGGDDFLRLHGAVRGLRPLHGERGHD
jgi:hydrogenase maturation protease